MRLLHFADAHIDMVGYGRHDPATGLPVRVMDFLKSLDTIIETAISERVDLVIFAGDAYKDRSPAPTYQREWGKRIMRLSQAGIRTLLLVGNHDLSPAYGRAHAVQEFDTLQVPYVTVLDRPRFLTAEEIGLPVQVIALPWVHRSGLLAQTETRAQADALNTGLTDRLIALVEGWLARADVNLPIILTAHASVEGAQYGAERNVMIGHEWTLPGSLVRDPRLDYVALGHIHRAQNLNEGAHPPVIYPGSIERVDFSEAEEEKFFVIAEVQRGRTHVRWCKLTNIRPFIDRSVVLRSPEGVLETLQRALPPRSELKDAIVRLTITYPREWDTLIDEAALRRYTAEAFEFHLVRRPQSEVRIRLPEGQLIGSLTPLELLEKYLQVVHVEDAEALKALAQELLEEE